MRLTLLERVFCHHKKFQTAILLLKTQIWSLIPWTWKKIHEVIFNSRRRLKQRRHWVAWPYLSPLALNHPSHSAAVPNFPCSVFCYWCTSSSSFAPPSLKSTWALVFLTPLYTSRQHLWIPPTYCVLPSTSCLFALRCTRYGQTNLCIRSRKGHQVSLTTLIYSNVLCVCSSKSLLKITFVACLFVCFFISKLSVTLWVTDSYWFWKKSWPWQ